MCGPKSAFYSSLVLSLVYRYVNCYAGLPDTLKPVGKNCLQNTHTAH
jgi:hypothetical protein